MGFESPLSPQPISIFAFHQLFHLIFVCDKMQTVKKETSAELLTVL